MKRWYLCPICSKNLLKIHTGKFIEGVYIKCHCCKNEIEIINKPNND